MGTSPRPASARSCTADQTVCTCAARVWSRHTCTAVAPTARAASTAPSSTRCGARLSRAWSFSLAGSLSMPLATTTAGPRRDATDFIFAPAGNPAPPRPVRPAAATALARPPPRSGRWRSALGSGPYSASCWPRLAGPSWRRHPAVSRAGATTPRAASSGTGVPARRAQPGWSGPRNVNIAVASGIPISAVIPAARRGPGPARDSRQPAAAATAARHSTSTASSTGSRVSVPVPRPCHSATGQLA